MMAYDGKRGMEMEMNLDRLMPGLHGVVVSVNTDELLRLRLRDFGLVNGTKVTTSGATVDPDGVTLYTATLATGAVTIAKVGF